MVAGAGETVIPPLRRDLEFFPAPSEENGAPVWMIRDPLTSRFERAGYVQKLVLDRLDKPRTLDELYRLVEQDSTFPVSMDELLAFCRGVIARNLTVGTLQRPVEQLIREREASRPGIAALLLKNYLYFRVPLLRPDKFLENNLRWAKWFSSPLAACLYLLFSLAGVYLFLGKIDGYFHTFPRFYDMRGIVLYGAAIGAVKVLHEFAHAFTATSCGVRIPAMGVAFMVMFPVAYCDVTDGWRLRSRRRRFLISAAGILCELVIAGLSLFAWGVSSDGALRSLFFVISSVALAGTLLVNLNPGMRYDGYFLFGDLIGVDNLQARSVSVLKWLYRKVFLGVDAPCPEAVLSRGKLWIMSVYSVYAACYRFLLYVSIALMVYYAFDFKLLGVTLFFVEAAFFIARPFVLEARDLFRMRSALTMNAKIMITLLLLATLAAWVALPLSRTERLPAIILPREAQVIYAPYPGVLENVGIQHGDHVEAGQTLFRFSADDLDRRIRIVDLQAESIRHQMEVLPGDARSRSLLEQTRESLTRALAERAGLENIRGQLTQTASFSGRVYFLDELVRPENSVIRQQKLAVLAVPDKYRVTAYVPESAHAYIDGKGESLFVPDSGTSEHPVTIRAMSVMKMDYLQHRSLSSLDGNSIAVVADGYGRLKTVDSYYELDGILESSEETGSLCFDQTGLLLVPTKPYSLLMRWLRSTYAVLVREANL